MTAKKAAGAKKAPVAATVAPAAEPATQAEQAAVCPHCGAALVVVAPGYQCSVDPVAGTGCGCRFLLDDGALRLDPAHPACLLTVPLSSLLERLRGGSAQPGS